MCISIVRLYLLWLTRSLSPLSIVRKGLLMCYSYTGCGFLMKNDQKRLWHIICYSNSCYGDINAYAIVNCYGDMHTVAIVNYVLLLFSMDKMTP